MTLEIKDPELFFPSVSANVMINATVISVTNYERVGKYTVWYETKDAHGLSGPYDFAFEASTIGLATMRGHQYSVDKAILTTVVNFLFSMVVITIQLIM